MIAGTAQTHLGVGLYSLAEAARIIREPVGNVRRWASVSGGLVPRILNSEEQTITFIELIELHFVKMFRAEGVSLQTIRRASRAAAARFDTAYPFAVKRFDTDGRSIFATLRSTTSNRNVLEDLERGQYVFQQIMRPFFRKLEYGTTRELVRFWPLTKRRPIVLDPKRKFGKPIDVDSGVPTEIIVSALHAGGGQSPAVVARWLGVSLRAVRAAVDFEEPLPP